VIRRVVSLQGWPGWFGIALVSASVILLAIQFGSGPAGARPVQAKPLAATASSGPTPSAPMPSQSSQQAPDSSSASSVASGAPSGHRVTVISLQAAYQAQLAHPHKQGPIAGISYAPGKQPKAARTASLCIEPDCPMSYHGGPVQHTPHVYLLFWGPNWQGDAGQDATMNYLLNYFDGLGVGPQDTWSATTDQYGDTTGHPAYSGSVLTAAYQDTSSPPVGLTDSQLGTEADALASSVGISDLTNAQIVIASQPGTCPQGFYAPSCNGGSGYYCAYHSNSNVPYTNLPYLLDSTGSQGCGQAFINNGRDGFGIVEGHEFAETVTDPFPSSGWADYNDSSGGEIGDKCAWQNLADVALSTGSFAMQPLWSNSANACVMSTSVSQQTVQDSSPLVTYGYWQGVTDAAASGGTYRQNAFTSGHAQFTFSGTAVKWATIKGPDKGIASVTINGVSKGKFDLYSATKTPSVLTFSGLSSTSHTIKIVVTGTKNSASSGYNVPIDAFIAGTTTTQDTSTKITYGWWTGKTSTSASGGTYRSAASAGPASFTFTGTRIDWITTTGPSYGKAEVYLDGVDQGTVDLYSPTTHWKTAKSYTASGPGTHTLTIQVLAQKNTASTGTAVIIDAFTVP
jgi:hypothetical protein